MAGFIARGKQIIANTEGKDQVEPSAQYFQDVKDAFVRSDITRWETNVALKGLAFNPANPDDPFDIGTLAGEVFTPADAGTINKTTAFNYIDCIRAFNSAIMVNDETNTVIDVSEAGESITEALTARGVQASTDATTNFGDPSTDTDV